MANPLKDWKLGNKKEEAPTVLPLQKAPEWSEEAGLWCALLSKKVEGASTVFPDLKGKFVSWAGTLYEVTTQEKITDQKMLRNLNNSLKLGETRVYYRVHLEEIDARLALSLRRRK